MLVHSYLSQPTLEQPDAPWKWRIPARYGDPQTSPLTAEIAAHSSGPLAFAFELVD